MKTFAMIAAAAAAIALATPAAAQGFSVRVGEPGYRHHHHYHDDFRGPRAHYRGGRDVVVIKKSRPHYHMRRPGRTVVIER